MEEESKREADSKPAAVIPESKEGKADVPKTAHTFLCIHGYQQSDTIFDKKIKVMTKHLLTIFPKSKFIFPKGPHLIDPADEGKPEEERKYGWLFFNKDNKLDYAEGWKKEKEVFDGWVESFAVLKKTLEENPDIDSIIAFSQGGLVASLLLVLQKEGELEGLLKGVKCIIIASAVGSPVPENLTFCLQYAAGDKKLDIPCLGVMGSLDDHVECWRTEKLLTYYSKVERYVHEGKHFIPCKKPDLEVYSQFLKKYL